MSFSRRFWVGAQFVVVFGLGLISSGSYALAAESAKVEPYTGPAILLDEPEKVDVEPKLVTRQTLKEKLGEFRKTLVGKDKELAIFDERLVADEPLTLQELGDRFGISRERVRQLEQRLTSRLRDFLRDEIGDAAELA